MSEQTPVDELEFMTKRVNGKLYFKVLKRKGQPVDDVFKTRSGELLEEEPSNDATFGEE